MSDDTPQGQSEEKPHLLPRDEIRHRLENGLRRLSADKPGSQQSHDKLGGQQSHDKPRLLPKEKPDKPTSPLEDEPSGRSAEESAPKAEAKAVDESLIDTDELRKKSKDELIQIIIELKSKIPRATDQLAPSLARVSFEAKADAKVSEYRRLPLVTPESRTNTGLTTWRLKLISSNPEHEPLGLEIYDDVIVGRMSPDSRPDLDLSVFGAERLGVSRQHTLLRPTRTSLFLIDLDSTNGTYRNGFRLGAGIAQKLSDNDTISFARLHFVVRIVKKPTGVG